MLPALPGDPARYLANTRSPATRRAYARDWAHYLCWCQERQRTPLPTDPGELAGYLAWCADRGASPATLGRRLVAIGHANEAAGLPNPCHAKLVRETLRGIRRTLGTAQRQASPVLVDELKRMVATCSTRTLLGLRDRALLLFGFASALRRSELVALDLADLNFQPRGLVVTVRKSKTDQEGAGRRLVVMRGHKRTCPVAALWTWLGESGITYTASLRQAVFCAVDRHSRVGGRLSAQSIRLVVSRAAEAAGVPPRTAHGLRAGLCTAAALAGASERDIAKVSGHRSMRVLRSYIRDADLWRNNVSGMVGL